MVYNSLLSNFIYNKNNYSDQGKMKLSSSRIERKFQVRYLTVFAMVIINFLNQQDSIGMYGKK